MLEKKYIYEVDINSSSAQAKVLRLVGNGKRVLEIGCSSGSQSKIMANELECQVVGLEIDPKAAQDAKAFCERIIVGNVENIDLQEELAEELFDVILFSDVLEHFYDPQAVLCRVGNYLKSDGYLLASIPNIVHSAIIYEMAHGRFDYRPYGLLDNTHIRFFTRKSIYNLFESSGYEITLFDRSKLRPENTEFKNMICDKEDMSFMDYIHKNNNESDTYQFVIKAVKFNSECHSYSLIDANEKIRDLQRLLNENASQISKLRSENQWLSQPISKRLIRRFTRR